MAARGARAKVRCTENRGVKETASPSENGESGATARYIRGDMERRPRLSSGAAVFDRQRDEVSYADTVLDKSATLAGTDDSGSDQTLNGRMVFKPAVLGAASGSQIRVTVLFGTGSTTLSGAITSMFVGQGAAAGNEWNFTGNQVQLLFSGAGMVDSSPAGI
jgi:hypothetical protein